MLSPMRGGGGTAHSLLRNFWQVSHMDPQEGPRKLKTTGMEDIAALLDQLMYHAVLAFSPSVTKCCHGTIDYTVTGTYLCLLVTRSAIKQQSL